MGPHPASAPPYVECSQVTYPGPTEVGRTEPSHGPRPPSPQGWGAGSCGRPPISVAGSWVAWPIRTGASILQVAADHVICHDECQPGIPTMSKTLLSRGDPCAGR